MIFGKQDNDIWPYRNTIMPVDDSPSATFIGERHYTDEAEMIEVVNSVLPVGGDARHALDLIGEPTGYAIEMTLTDSQAALLGWLQRE